MANKYYAVKQGRQTGIFSSWADCKAQVMGFSGAVYKSFPTMEEAQNYLSGVSSAATSQQGEAVIPEVEAIAYVDGSYQHATKCFSYGAIIFYQGQTFEMAQKYDDPALVDMRNVAGELKGAEQVMQFCLDHHISSVAIYHDYEGIARWCTGEWQAKKSGTQAYRQFYQMVSQKVKVHFIKVKGHSGDKYNDWVDRLAKQALEG